MIKKKIIFFTCFFLLIGLVLFNRNKIINLLRSNKNEVRIGICCGEPPYEYLNEKGEISGLNKQIVDKVLDVLEINKKLTHWKVIPISDAFFALDNEKIDILATILYISEARENRYDFAVVSESYPVFLLRENKNPKAAIYGIQPEAVFSKEAKELGFQCQVLLNIQDIVLNFQMEKIDGMIIDIQSLKEILKHDKKKSFLVKKLININLKKINETPFLFIDTKKKKKSDYFYGTVQENAIILTYAEAGIYKVYYDYEKMTLAFLCDEIHNIILGEKNLKEKFLFYAKIKCNSELIKSTEYENTYFKCAFLNMHTVIIQKEEGDINKPLGFINFSEEKVESNHRFRKFPDFNSMLSAFFDGNIRGFCLDLSSTKNQEIITSFYIDAPSIVHKGKPIKNGFAFRKIPLNNFDHVNKKLFIEKIEEEANNSKDIKEYKILKVEEKINKEE